MSEPGFVNGVWLVLENSLGCELDRTFVVAKPDHTHATENIRRELFYWLADAVLEVGDVIRIVSGESEVE